MSAAGSVTTTFSNAVNYQFDTDGNAIDLTSTKVDFLGGNYVFYGLKFGCGDAFCGIVCAENENYVLWVNQRSPGYRYFIRSNPTSGYAILEDRALVGLQPPGPFQAGDFSVQTINSTGHLAYSLIDFTTNRASIWPPFNQSIYFQQLTPSMQNTTGSVSHVVNQAFDLVDFEAESPDIFRRGDYFYITASNTCGFCTGTLLIVYRSKSVSGPWKSQIISADTCGGQSTGVLTFPSPVGGPTSYLHVADLVKTAPLAGSRNGANGHQFKALSFNQDCTVKDLNCNSKQTFPVTLIPGTSDPAEGLATMATDSAGETAAYTPTCNLPVTMLYQTWACSKSGTLSEVGVNIAGDNPTGNLTTSVFRYQNHTNFFTPHYV